MLPLIIAGCTCNVYPLLVSSYCNICLVSTGADIQLLMLLIIAREGQTLMMCAIFSNSEQPLVQYIQFMYIYTCIYTCTCICICTC